MSHLLWIQAQHPGFLPLSVSSYSAEDGKLSHMPRAWTSRGQTCTFEIWEEKAGRGPHRLLRLLTSTFICHTFASAEFPVSLTSFLRPSLAEVQGSGHRLGWFG